MNTTAKLTIATAVAALAVAVAPAVAGADDLPNLQAANCRGQAISDALAIAREAGYHGLGNTVGGPGLDSVHDLQQIITEFCRG